MKRIVLLVCLCAAGVFLFRKLTKPPPFQDEVAAFQVVDKQQMPPSGAILFVGSSSMFKWEHLADSFQGYTLIQRGIAAASFPDIQRYADKIIFQYHPKQVVLYCGDNDFAYYENITPEKVFGRFKELFLLIRQKLPEAYIDYISIKPSPERWNFEKSFLETNSLIRTFLEKQDHAAFINIHDAMLLPGGGVDSTLFQADRLHLNAKGYNLWEEIIKPYLLK